MKKAYRVTIGRIIARYDWDPSGVALAALLLLGEAVAAFLAAVSLTSEGFGWGNLAALLGAAVLVLYVPLAIWKGKMPFAVSTDYEKRRRYAQATLGVSIPRSGDRAKDGTKLSPHQTNLENDSDESIRVAVGRAYASGDFALQRFCTLPWVKDVKVKIELARLQLTPPTASMAAITYSPELMEQSEELQQATFIAEPNASTTTNLQDEA